METPSRACERWAKIARLPVLLVLCALARASVAGAQPPTVSWTVADEGQRLAAPEGHAWLKWAPDADQPVDGYVVERRSPGGEAVSRRIANAATFIAGLPEGVTEVRVRAVRGGVEGPWSDELHIDVSYPPMAQVWFLAGLGSLLFIATVVLILAGHRRFGGAAGAGSEANDDG